MANYSNLFRYLPVRYNPCGQQLEDNREVYRFKDGDASFRIIEGFANKINNLTSGCYNDWVVVFMPASTASKTITRYTSLAESLRRRVKSAVSTDALYNLYDREASVVTGKTSNPTESFGIRSNEVRGKRVILIDDVITRGVSFSQMEDKLIAAGAKDVYGLFVAETYNPY